MPARQFLQGDDKIGKRTSQRSAARRELRPVRGDGRGEKFLSLWPLQGAGAGLL